MFTVSLRNFQQSFPGLVCTAGAGAIAPWRWAAALVLLTGLTACGGVSDEIPAGNYVPPPIEWQLAFADEFDGDTLDSTKWNVDTGDGCPDLCGWGNNELQSYTADNIEVAGGVLTIQGRKELDGSYTSARINSRGKFDFTYGRVEISARLPEGKGIWPAIWMLPSDETVYGPWPRGGEIDIVEAFNPGVDGNTSIKSTTHYGLPTEPYNGTSSANDLGVSPSLGFHQYTMEWERDTLRFFVDGVHFQTQKASNWYSYFPADALGYFNEYGAFKLGPRDAPFDQLFHLILNLAIGGDPVGNPDDSTVFPQNFEIDYVRVYECANSNPDTERGCGVADASIVPLKDNDGGPLQSVETAQPYLERLDLYVDGPEVIELNVGGEIATNTLLVNGYTGEGAAVINDPMAADPDDPANIVWHVAVSGGVANVYLESQDLTDDLILNTGFNFSGNRKVGPGGDPVGEIAFDMLINSIDEGTDLFVKLDSGYPNLGEVVIPASEIVVGAWKTYSIKFDMLLESPLGGGSGVDLENVANPFVFEVRNGAADVYIDNIRVTNACKVVGACGADLKTKGVPDLVVFDDAVNLEVWSSGIGASDSGSGYTDYFVGTDPTDKVNWSILADTDPERGNVIQVTFNDSAAFGVWFVKSPVAVDANAYNSGAVVFDIKVLDYGSNTTGMTFKVDCFFPCTSGDKALGVVGDGVWETITFPVSQLTSTGLDLSNVNVGLVVFPTTQAGGITFQLDNIRWVASSDAIPKAPMDLPVTFDDPGVDYALADFGGAVSSIGDDPAGGTNKVAITTRGAVGTPSEVWAGTTIGPAGGFASAIPFAAGQTSLSVKVYSPAVGVPVLLKVETEDNTVATSQVQVLTTVADAWETLVFDFSGGAPAIDLAQAYVRANIFFNFGTEGTGQTYYWDDVYFGDGAGPALDKIDLPVTFDDPNVNYYLEDFEGAATVLVSDPIVGAANTVAMTTKNGQPWAGTIMAAPPAYDFANPIPFSVDSTTLSVRVLSPAAGIPVALKVETADAVPLFHEVIVNTTVAGEWETLEFDYSTDGINTSLVWVRAIIFFDFQNDANGASYYWDDVMSDAVGPPPPRLITLPVTFDDTGLDYEITDFGGVTTTLVADPDNAANTVASSNKTPAAALWGGTTVAEVSGFGALPFTATDTTMTVRVYSPDAGIPVRLKVEDRTDPTISVETEATTTVANAWETLTFDFSAPAAGTAALNLANTYDKASIFFNFGTDGATAGDKTYLWDDLYFVDGAPPPRLITLPVTFDVAGLDYEVTDFGGVATTLVADPDNAANTVASSNKTPAAALWGGTTVAEVSGFGALPFTATDTTMTVRVYSPDAGIPVRLKVEDRTDPTISVETEATTTVANAWETLTFDFSSPAAGTAALNLANTYDKASIFFNFGTDGATAGDKTYLWEDLAFVAGSGGGGGSASTDFEGDSYTFSDFGGAVATVIANPDVSGINISAQVAQMQKFAGEVYAGSTLDLGGAVALSAGDSYTMQVRAQRSVVVTFKLETGGALTTATHTGSGTWEELCFDFTGVAATVTGITVIFDNGTAGDAANDPDNWTFQFDGIQQIAGSCPATGPTFASITFDDAAVTYTLTDFGGNAAVVTNDPAGGTNMVMQAHKSDTAELWAGTTISTEANNSVPRIPLDAANTTMTVRVYSPDAGIPVRLKIEDASNDQISVETEATTTVVNTWETLTFDFSSPAAGTAALNLANTYNKVSIFFNFGTTGVIAGAKTYYADDIELGSGSGGGSAITLPVTFDVAGLDYEVTDFGGVATTLVADPDNAANTVASSNKTPAAALWGGTTVAEVSGFGALPFTATDTTMTVRVYSPDAGIPVRLKVEDRTDPTISVETEATTTVADAWETLTFDFSSPAAGTAALNLANTYDKASIFFNFGTDGATAGDKTYLWDDLEWTP